MEYTVLKDFWLRDVKLLKNQIITDPVSQRWIELGLIKPVWVKDSTVEKITKNAEINSQNKASEVDEQPVKRKKKGNVTYDTKETSEKIVEHINSDEYINN